jgi:hypothetical protein
MVELLKQLEIIKNSIAIEDYKTISLQVQELPEPNKDKYIKDILLKLKQLDYLVASDLISKYLKINYKNSNIILYNDKELEVLKLEFKNLELITENLKDEKTKYINDIKDYKNQYNIYLGDLIKKVLGLKKEILNQKTIKQNEYIKKYEEQIELVKETSENINNIEIISNNINTAINKIDKNTKNYNILIDMYKEISDELKELKKESFSYKEDLNEIQKNIEDNLVFKEAKTDFNEFKTEYENIKELGEEKFNISEDQNKELKKIWKKACKLCHPDIVENDLIEKAHDIMQILNEAYSRKDIELVKKIFKGLENGTSFTTVNYKTKDKNLIKAKIKEYQEIKLEIETDIKRIKLNKTFLTIKNIDDWNKYFEKIKKELLKEEMKLKDKIKDNSNSLKLDTKSTTQKSIKNDTTNNSCNINYM